ncbi:MAG: polyprenyl synthetase family protein [Bryobacteraceae bacterium]|nr:polyprenyl synthetase family protein [Bryobacteraceae bacterium]
MTVTEYLREQTQHVDAALNRWVPADTIEPVNIHRAMRYSLFAGGKRIRPALCLSAAYAIADDVQGVDDVACTLEMIHTYSLVHDDLPALDNDDLRRGRPTNHKVFGEAMAILTGDALLTLAFGVISSAESIDAESRVALVRELATASGTVRGMIGGQVHDIEGEGKSPTPELLETIHRAKTGALLRASVRMGAICGGANAHQLEALSAYGEHVGLAFQIVDDVLDVEQSSESLGKTAGKDAEQGKVTFPAVYGLERSHQMAEAELHKALDALAMFGDRGRWLRGLADLVVHRKA